MPSFYSAPDGLSSSAARIELMQRSSQRITFSCHWALHKRLQDRADREGRSLSNLVAFLLETAPTE